METLIKELQALWVEYQRYRSVETLDKADKLNSHITFELIGNEAFPDICNIVNKEASERICDIYLYQSNTLMNKPNVRRAYQMYEFRINNAALEGNKAYYTEETAKTIIETYDLIKDHVEEIEELSNKIHRNIEDGDLCDYSDIDRVLRLNDVIELYRDNYEQIRDLFEDKQTVSDNKKQLPTLPKELDTETGRAVLQRGVGKILDKNYQLLEDTTNGQAYAFVLCVKEELKLKNHWIIFEKLWKKKNLKSSKLSNTKSEKIEEIKKMFPRHIFHNALYNKN